MFSKRSSVQIKSVSPRLSQAIKQCRQALEMSQKDLSRKIRRSVEYVQDLENSAVAIDSQTLEDCATSFGLSVGELVEIAISESVIVVAEIVNTGVHDSLTVRSAS